MVQMPLTDEASKARYRELKKEKHELGSLIEKYKELQAGLTQAWGLPEYEAPDNRADRAFIYDKLTEAKKKMESVKYGDDLTKQAVEAEIAILEKALEYWDGAADKKKAT